MLYLSFEFLEEDFDYVLLMKFDFELSNFDPDITELTRSLEAIYVLNQDSFILLTPRKKLPLYKERADEFIHSFRCTFKHFRKLMAAYNRMPPVPGNLLFELMDHILNHNSGFQKILVRQIPIQDIQMDPLSSCDVIIPHRGNIGYLDSLLFFLSQINNLRVAVGIDETLTKEILRLKDRYSGVSFYSFQPNPVGPYVIRNQLISLSESDLLFFQDSDDISCADRFEHIAHYMKENACQLCGSHEVKLNYFNRNVQAVRYPQDVMKALKRGPAHSLLHPSSAIERTAFELNGKLSEERVFGNDSKLLYHGFFLLDDIRNVDEFLYIRRIHANSLTTGPETHIGSPARNNLLSRLVTDFELVKIGILKLENSSLKYEAPGFNFEVKKI